jgi:hypothetical protein
MNNKIILEKIEQIFTVIDESHWQDTSTVSRLLDDLYMEIKTHELNKIDTDIKAN